MNYDIWDKIRAVLEHVARNSASYAVTSQDLLNSPNRSRIEVIEGVVTQRTALINDAISTIKQLNAEEVERLLAERMQHAAQEQWAAKAVQAGQVQ